MAYVGQPPFQEFTNPPTKDSFTGDGSTVAFDMSATVASNAQNALEVYVNNVRQEPGTGKAFTLGVDGSNDNKRITFTAAPANGAAIYVINDKTNTSVTAPLSNDLNGTELILDGDGDTSITADTDDRIDFKLAGVEHISIGNSSGDTIIKTRVDAKDIMFQQFDGRDVLEINDAGFVALHNGDSGSGQLRIYEDDDNGANFTAFQVGTQSADITYTLPTADGSSGQAITTNGSGVLSFATVAANTPTSADGQALGSASLEWSDLFLADASTIQFGADQDVILTHVADTGLTLNSTMKLMFNDASQFIHAPSATVLDIAATDEIELTATEVEINVTTLDVNGNLDVSGTIVGASTLSATTGTFSGILKTDDSTAATSTTDGSLQTDGGLSVAGDAIIGDDVTLISDAAVLSFGANAEVTLTHVHNDGLLLNTDMQLQFRDSAINIRSDADGDLDINADDEIELNSTLIDINGNVEISGTAVTTGVHTFTAVPVFPNDTIETADIQADAVDGTKIADDAINSEHYTDGSIDTAHIADLNVTEGKIAADAITGAKIADNAINSEHYTDGSIDTAHLADAQITTAKLSTAVFTGATDIGAAIVDADLFLMDDGAGGTIRKTTAARIKTYAGVSGDVTTIDSILKADIKIGEDDETKIDFETANEIHLYANNVEQVYLADNIFGPQSDGDVDLGTTGVRWKDAYIDTLYTSSGSNSLIVSLGVTTAKDLGSGIHVRTADSGGDVQNYADELVLEGGAAGTGMTILCQNDQSGSIMFGDQDDNDVAFIQYSHGSEYMRFITNAVEHMRIDGIGAVTKPLQPAFSVTTSATQLNMTEDADNTIVFGLEIFDTNGDFASNSFTAPVAGKYMLTAKILTAAIDHDGAYYAAFKIVTSNRNYSVNYSVRDFFEAQPEFWPFQVAAVVDMDASDTAYVRYRESGPGASQTDVYNAADAGAREYHQFTGYLLG